jgi:Ca-activated chloride channel family protein
MQLLARVGTLTLVVVASLVPAAVGGQEPDLKRRDGAPALAGEPRGAPQDDVVKLGTDLVVLDVSVVDRSNQPVYDIAKNRFRVFEDDVEQQVEFFSKEEAPVSLALAVDTSGTMRTKLDEVVVSAISLVRANRPADETAVIQFKDRVELLEELTTDERDVEDALGDLVSSGPTALLDAILLSAEYVQKEGRHRRRALLVVTDGLEHGSYYTSEHVIDRLRELDVRLYLIGFTQDLSQTGGLFRKAPRDKAEELLRRLADETGGRAFFPKDLSELGTISNQIAVDLRTVYAIGYYPTNNRRDGAFRRVSVKIAPAGDKQDRKLVARTRSGYYAGKP